MAQPPIYLTILRKGDTNIVDLAEVGSLIPRSETQVDGAFLQELTSEIARIATPGYGRRGSHAMQEETSLQELGVVVRDLQRIGGLIFSHLLTEPARRRLRTADPCDLYLRLDEQLIHVPWELCHDGNNFLATKFRVGRQVITGYPIPETLAKREVRGPLRVLLIADPTESLPEAGDEADQLCALLDKIAGVEVTLLGGKGVRKVPLLAELQAHDVVHFAGHSYYDPDNPSKSGWCLSEGVLTAGELSKLSRPPLLVFSNSCQAGATAEWEGGYRYEGQAFGIGSAFLLAGVKNYIGTFWVVHDEESVLFAIAFYWSLASGLSLGEALLKARQEVIRQKGWESLTWASYMLYGDPTSTLLPAAKEQLQPVPFPPEKTIPKEQQETPLPPASEKTGKGGETQPRLCPACGEEVFAEAAFCGSCGAKLKAGKRWWSWRPHLRLRVWISLSVTFAAILSFVYLLSRPAVQTMLPFPAPSLRHAPPSFVLREYERAFENLRAGQIEAALSAFQWIATAPENSLGLGYDGLAIIYFEKGLLNEAKEALQKSLAANPANVMALLIQGDISFAMGEKEKASSEYLQATKAETQWGWQKALAYNALGVSYSLEGKQAEARDCFNKALSASTGVQLNAPSVFAAYSNLGYLSWQEGDLQGAKGSFEKALNLQPEDELSRTFLELISAKESQGSTKGTGEKVLIVPLALGGGNLRRLGEGEALAWRLVRHLPPAVQPEMVGQDFLQEGRQGELSHDPAALMALAREKGAAYIVWGELQSFSTKLIIHGQVTDLKKETTKRVSYVQEGVSGRLEAAAQVLVEQVGKQ